MVPEDRADKGIGPGSREPRGTLSQRILRIISQLLGGAVETTVESEPQDDLHQDTLASEPEPAQSVAQATQALEQALARLQSLLERLEQQVGQQPSVAERAEASEESAGLKRALGEAFQRLGDTLGQLGVYVERLSREASDLRLVESRLEGRMDELTRMFGEARAVLERQPRPEREPVAPEEPQFWPNDRAVGVLLAAVPGFQGLMDAQRALSGLPAAEGASVVAYKNGEASLEVTLRAPVSARQIVEGLRASTGHEFLIEEARPEALRLRLRFVDQEGRG